MEEIHANCSMAGDVNLFLNQVEIENEEEEEEKEPVSSLGTRLEAECEVMIAGKYKWKKTSFVSS